MSREKLSRSVDRCAAFVDRRAGCWWSEPSSYHQLRRRSVLRQMSLRQLYAVTMDTTKRPHDHAYPPPDPPSHPPSRAATHDRLAFQVVNIDMTHCDLSTRYGDGTGKACDGEGIHADHQRMSLLSEVQTMIRLRSPHTVNVYGVMTTAKDRLVLMMELLTGGDLRSFLRYAEERLPESLTRQLIGDVCAGVAFLHSKKAVHGDLKSPNILLDGECRAKVRSREVDERTNCDRVLTGEVPGAAVPARSDALRSGVTSQLFDARRSYSKTAMPLVLFFLPLPPSVTVRPSLPPRVCSSAACRHFFPCSKQFAVCPCLTLSCLSLFAESRSRTLVPRDGQSTATPRVSPPTGPTRGISCS